MTRQSRDNPSDTVV